MSSQYYVKNYQIITIIIKQILFTVEYDSDLVDAAQEQWEEEDDQSHHQDLISVF